MWPTRSGQTCSVVDGVEAPLPTANVRLPTVAPSGIAYTTAANAVGDASPAPDALPLPPWTYKPFGGTSGGAGGAAGALAHHHPDCWGASARAGWAVSDQPQTTANSNENVPTTAAVNLLIPLRLLPRR